MISKWVHGFLAGWAVCGVAAAQCQWQPKFALTQYGEDIIIKSVVLDCSAEVIEWLGSEAG